MERRQRGKQAPFGDAAGRTSRNAAVPAARHWSSEGHRCSCGGACLSLRGASMVEKGASMRLWRRTVAPRRGIVAPVEEHACSSEAHPWSKKEHPCACGGATLLLRGASLFLCRRMHGPRRCSAGPLRRIDVPFGALVAGARDGSGCVVALVLLRGLDAVSHGLASNVGSVVRRQGEGGGSAASRSRRWRNT